MPDVLDVPDEAAFSGAAAGFLATSGANGSRLVSRVVDLAGVVDPIAACSSPEPCPDAASPDACPDDACPDCPAAEPADTPGAAVASSAGSSDPGLSIVRASPPSTNPATTASAGIRKRRRGGAEPEGVSGPEWVADERSRICSLIAALLRAWWPTYRGRTAEA